MNQPKQRQQTEYTIGILRDLREGKSLEVCAGNCPELETLSLFLTKANNFLYCILFQSYYLPIKSVPKQENTTPHAYSEPSFWILTCTPHFCTAENHVHSCSCSTFPAWSKGLLIQVNSFHVSGELNTYPFPNPTFLNLLSLRAKCWVRGGVGGEFSRNM